MIDKDLASWMGGVAISRSVLSGWRLMFRVAALFNWSVAIPLWIAPVPLSQLFGFEPVPTHTLYTDLFAVVVLTFGIGYWLVGSNPVRNRVMVEMGIIGKLLVVLVGYGHFLSGTTTLSFAALVSCDLIWTIAFWRFLTLHPEQHIHAGRLT
jgi:energy-converting hydrogenase Eha subunit E